MADRRLAALAGLLAYGGIIALLQSLTPSRSPEFGDLVADVIRLAVARFWRRFWRAGWRAASVELPPRIAAIGDHLLL